MYPQKRKASAEPRLDADRENPIHLEIPTEVTLKIAGCSTLERCRASDHAHVLEAAIAAQASRLAGFNTGDFTDASQSGVEVVTPGEFLRTIE